MVLLVHRKHIRLRTLLCVCENLGLGVDLVGCHFCSVLACEDLELSEREQLPTIMESEVVGHITEDENCNGVRRLVNLFQLSHFRSRPSILWNSSTLSAYASSPLMVKVHGLLVLCSGQIVCLGRHV